MWLKEIRLRVQNVVTILSSVVNVIGGGDPYDHSLSILIIFDVHVN